MPCGSSTYRRPSSRGPVRSRRARARRCPAVRPRRRTSGAGRRPGRGRRPRSRRRRAGPSGPGRGRRRRARRRPGRRARARCGRARRRAGGPRPPPRRPGPRRPAHRERCRRERSGRRAVRQVGQRPGGRVEPGRAPGHDRERSGGTRCGACRAVERDRPAAQGAHLAGVGPVHPDAAVRAADRRTHRAADLHRRARLAQPHDGPRLGVDEVRPADDLHPDGDLVAGRRCGGADRQRRAGEGRHGVAGDDVALAVALQHHERVARRRRHVDPGVDPARARVDVERRALDPVVDPVPGFAERDRRRAGPGGDHGGGDDRTDGADRDENGDRVRSQGRESAQVLLRSGGRAVLPLAHTTADVTPRCPTFHDRDVAHGVAPVGGFRMPGFCLRGPIHHAATTADHRAAGHHQCDARGAAGEVLP